MSGCKVVRADGKSITIPPEIENESPEIREAYELAAFAKLDAAPPPPKDGDA